MFVIKFVAVFLLSFSTNLSPVLTKTFQYGKGVSDFGISGVDKGEPMGPYSFAVNTQNKDIYIPDPLNYQIKVVSITGLLEKSIPFSGYFDDIRVDEQGKIYILDRMGQRIISLDQEGKAAKEYDLDYETVKNPCKLALKNNTPYVKLPNYMLINAVSKGKTSEKYEVDLHKENLDIFVHENGTINQIVSININGIVSAEILGTDAKGNIYVQAEVKNKEIGVTLKVLKFNEKGELTGDYKIPENDYFVWTARLLDIDNDGNIYQVLPAKDRLKINVWKTE